MSIRCGHTLSVRHASFRRVAALFVAVLALCALTPARADTLKPLEPVDGKIGIFDLKKIRETPLQPETIDKREENGVIVEKVRFNSLPGVRVYGVLTYLKAAKGYSPYLLITPDGTKTQINEAKSGFVGFSICAPKNNKDPQKDLTVGGPPFNQNYTDDPDKSWIYHHVAALVRAIDYLATRPEANVKKTFVIGYSWAGFIGGLLHAIDNRPAAYFLYHGTGYYTDPTGISGNKPGVLTRRQYEMYSPAAYAEYGSSPVYVAEALTDYFGTFDAILEMYAKLRCPKSLAVVPNRAHAETMRKEHRTWYAWLSYWVIGNKDAKPIGIRDGDATTRDGKLIYSFEISNVQKPTFCEVMYSYGRPGNWTSRTWHRKAATAKTATTFECEIPIYDPTLPLYAVAQVETESRGVAANTPQYIDPQKLGIAAANAEYPHTLMNFEDKSDLYISVGMPTFVDGNAAEGLVYASIEPSGANTVQLANLEPFLWKNPKELRFSLKGDGQPGPIALYFTNDRNYWDFPRIYLVGEGEPFKEGWNEYVVSLDDIANLDELGTMVFETKGRRLQIDNIRWQ